MKKIIVSVFAIAAFTFSANAANTVSGTGSAELSTVIGIDGTTPWDGGFGSSVEAGKLQFGDIAIGSDEAIYVVSTLGALDESAKGTSQHMGGDVTAAGFKVTGTDNATFTVTVPTGDIAMGTGVELSSLITNVDGTIGAAGTLASGESWIAVGGTITIQSNASTGTHSALFNVTVNYQ